VFYGTDELLAGEAAELGRRAQAAGNDVLVRAVQRGQHSFIIGAGRVPEVDEAIAEIRQLAADRARPRGSRGPRERIAK
jgi:monoterpene epsilon-lactone hydrolase